MEANSFMNIGAETSNVQTVVEQAWQRRMLVLVVEQLAIAVILVMAGAALMMLLGTQILAGYWLWALAAIGIAVAVYRVRSRLTDRYRLAQMLDRRLQLSDTLSTAWYLRGQPDTQNAEASRYQIASAEKAVVGIMPSAVLPFTGGRLWAAAAAVTVLSMGMFTVRYLITDSISWQRSLIPLRIADVVEYIEKKSADLTGAKKYTANSDASSAASTPDAQKAPEQGDKSAKTPGSEAKGNSSDQSAAVSKPTDPTPNPEAKGDPSGDGQNGKPDSSASSDKSKGGEKSDASSQQDAKPGESGAKEMKAESQPNSNSMMDKMKDAISSMMSKIKPNPSGQQSANNNSQQNQKGAEDQKGSDQQQAKDQKGDAQQKSQNQQMAQEQNADGQQQGQSAEKAQTSQGKDSQQGSDKKGSDSHSGAGHSDGEKDIKTAEQAKAMGKLAEIIGKRSASITGDMTVENPSGKQQLQTSYTHAQGHHADLGGEINRDQVPVEDQQYVREYMELAHKQAQQHNK